MKLDKILDSKLISQYCLNDPSITLGCDLAAAFPLYLYLAADQQTLLYSISITALLNDTRVKKPLTVSHEGISFLLQSGVVPPPKTAYENVFIIGIGDSVQVKTINEKIQLTFKHEFPFLNANRLNQDEMQPDEDLILQMLAAATISRIDPSKPSFLFHSAGKDSNTIALALAEAGWQDQVTLITHKSKGQADESEVSRSIAKKLGFQHRTLYEVDHLESPHKKIIEEFFTNAPFPCTDGVALAYPLYTLQISELVGANIIDGMGNDVYMSRNISFRDLKRLYFSQFFSKFTLLRSWVSSENKLSLFLRTPAEMCNMGGLSYGDSKKIFTETISVYPYWQHQSVLRSNWDYYDFKSDLGTPISCEMFTRKVRNFCDSSQCNLILPFAHQSIAEYFGKMPEVYLFDRKQLKNKLILRQILKGRIGLDSDVVGKMHFTYDYRSVVLQNWDWFSQEIQQCHLWNQSAMVKLLARLKLIMLSKHQSSEFSRNLIYRVYLLSAWFNRNRYLSGSNK
jgi:asparagine synthase (glutamine-hydrolysing)